MAEDFSRPSSGYHFEFGGLSVTSPPDKLPEHKYATAQNVRAYDDKSLRSRPGMAQVASSSTSLPVEAIRTYATLGTDNLPRILFKNDTSPTTAGVYLDTGVQVDSGYAEGVGASLIPYRPNQSPQSWMYIGDASQYRKLSAPDASNAVTAQNVGIVEPQTPLDFGIGDSFFTPLAITNDRVPAYTSSGTLSVTGFGPRVADTVAAVFQDPALPPNTLPEYTVQTTSATQQYQTGMVVDIGAVGPANYYQVKDVYPALVGPMTVAGIYYYAGTTGRCVVVPDNVGMTDNVDLSIMQQNLLTGIRRGALVNLGGPSGFVAIPLAGGGSVTLGTGNGKNGVLGQVIALPAGYTPANTLVWASAGPGIEGFTQLSGVLSSSGAGAVLNTHFQNRSNGDAGPTSSNWAVAAWTAGAAVTVTTSGTWTYLSFTTAAGDQLCVGLGTNRDGDSIPAPAGFSNTRFQCIAGMATTDTTGHGLQSIFCSVNGLGVVTAEYWDGSANEWFGNANIFGLFWKTGGGVALSAVTGGTVLTIPLGGGQVLGLIEAVIPNGSNFGIPAGHTLMSSTASFNSFGGGAGSAVSHGIAACGCTGTTYAGLMQDGTGFQWPQAGNILALSLAGGPTAETCYVLSTAVAPDGTISFEIVTTGAHSAGETITGEPAIKVLQSSDFAGVGGQQPMPADAIGISFLGFTMTTGIGTLETPVTTTNPFSYQNVSYRPSDYIHFSIRITNLAAINEIKLLLDVSDGLFDSDYYYYAFRPSDIQQGISNTLTQLGAAQIVAQREVIDEEASLQGQTASSTQLLPGSALWSDIYIPLSQFIRVGSNQLLTLLNLNAFQVLVNASGDTFGQFGTVDICGGFSPDLDIAGADYKYVFRPRSTLTGALGNPSPVPRYGIRPRRELVQVVLPTTYPDPQVDTLDIFRVGGSLNAFTFIGTAPLGTAYFYDNYEDADVESNQQLDYDNYQPWPTIDVPLNTTSVSSCGTTALVTITDPTTQANVLRYLPGNLVQLGQQVYTLWTRPTVISDGVYLFQFVENSGAEPGSESVSLYEPAMANQTLPYLWGPTEQGGNIFGCGDPLRPGFVSFSKNFQPDSAPDSYNLELCPPSEPLLGGEVLNGNSYASSTERWWQLRPSFGGEDQYTPIEAPVGRGLAAPYGHCTDGERIYFVAKDGVYATSGGPGESLTDVDLYVLFPHDGVPGQNVAYAGVTTYAPDYGRAAGFRLAYYKSYLFFDYQDSSGIPRNLVYDMRHQAWSTDVVLGGAGATVHYGIEQQAGSLDATDASYDLLLTGSTAGVVYQQADNALDGALPIQCVVATREATCGDDRAQKLFGDFFLDFLNPASAGSTNLQVQAMSLGAAFGTTALTQNASRQQVPVDVGGGMYAFALGVRATWAMPVAMAPVVLYTWQPSYVVKPETIAGRAQDWDNAGYAGAKWIQGFILEANTFGDAKLLGVRNGDNQVLQQTFTVNHAIQSEIAYSFTTPFVAHMMRVEPQDGVEWDFFNVKWVWERTPETVTTWWTQFSDLEWPGYGHVYACNFAYASQAAVTFTMFFDDNTQTYTLPSTGGVYSKIFLNLQANKGKLYAFRLQSTAGFSDLQVWEQDCIVEVKGWGVQDGYRNHVCVGGERGDTAKI